MTSAYLPALTVPTSRSTFIATAGQYVAARIANIGSTLRRFTHVASSFHVEQQWKFIGTPESVSMSSTTPDSCSCLNFRASVGRRLGTNEKYASWSGCANDCLMSAMIESGNPTFHAG